MSGNNDSSAGFWIVMVALCGLVLYFWREVLVFILEVIIGLLKLAQNIVVEIVSIAAFIGVLYLISQIFKSKKK